MGSLLNISTTPILILAFFCGLSSCSDYLHPNFTASYLQFVDINGIILSSRNGTYKAVIYNPGAQQTDFYLCVIHDQSNTIIWSANRDHPVSNSGEMLLTSDGIVIYDDNGIQIWSTPPKLKSLVSSLHLTEMGNLMLLDQSNISVWNSFDHPTDTIVIGQQLGVGTLLTSAVSASDLSSSNYTLSVTSSDAVLQWQGSTYWKLSMSLNAYTNSTYVVEYLLVNTSGVSLLASQAVVIMQIGLPPADFRMAKLDVSGQLIVSSFSRSLLNQDFIGPSDKCEIPFICGRLGLCSSAGTSNPICSCPSSFRSGSDIGTACTPTNTSLALPNACNSTNNGTSSVGYQHLSYIELANGIDYFAVSFLSPIKYGVNLSVCQGFCSLDCSCLGMFYMNATGTCFLLHNHLGSVISTTSDESKISGYIKAVVVRAGSPGGNERRLLSLVPLVIFPLAALFVVATVGVLGWKRWRSSRVGMDKLGYLNSSSSGEMEIFGLPGLPVRYTYEELSVATENFRVQIGCGAFGSVYKGILSDTSVVAVKRITNLGVHGKREFCTEIAIIGNVHHVNLVKLKGYCAQGRQRLLVYEYMSHGSLDRSLFGGGGAPVLEWQERLDIALGTARGLAYLHRGCEQKIIHCDIKPENILLHGHFQPKISDFGLSKLLTPEQSSHFTTMRGTRGYLAPEWLTSSAISERTDVYSYGMVLFELVSGRKNCSFKTQSHSLDGESSSAGNNSMSSSSYGLIYFPMFALEMHEQGRYLDLVDPRLEGRVTSEEVEKLVRVALCCVHEDPSMRPNMLSVVGMLEGTIELGHPCMDSLNFLRFYGRRFAEASTIEDGNEASQSALYQQRSFASTASPSPASISFISSQEISGPR